jgi:hypothetical protein
MLLIGFGLSFGLKLTHSETNTLSFQTLLLQVAHWVRIRSGILVALMSFAAVALIVVAGDSFNPALAGNTHEHKCDV